MKFWIIHVSVALFIAGCAGRTGTVVKKPVPPAPVVAETNTTKVIKKKVTQKPKKTIKLKEVQDDNYSSSYMYPEDKVKKEKVLKVETVATAETVTAISNAMGKEECVGMIGQAKFDKYTQMFGNEASSIKRCAMLKAMR